MQPAGTSVGTLCPWGWFALKRSTQVLLGGILLFHAGWYILLPFLAVLLTARRGLTPAQTGMVLAMQSVALLFGSISGGLLSDRSGRRTTMVLGLFLRAAGVWGLGIAADLGGFLAAAAVAGYGGGLYGPSAKAALAKAEQGRTDVFSFRGIAANIGITLGPLVGSLLVPGPVWLLFGVAAGLHLVLAVATWGLLGEERAERPASPAPFADVISDVPFVLFSLVMGLGWALFAQLTLAMPLYARNVLGLESGIGLVWSVSSVSVIVLQVWVSRNVLSTLRPMTALSLGVLLLGAGLGMVGLARSLAELVGAALIFALGEMLLIPTSDTTVSQMARPMALGSYFGIATLSWGLGEGVGNYLGGILMQFSLAAGRPSLPFALYAVAGGAVGGLFWLLGLWRPILRRSSASAGSNVIMGSMTGTHIRTFLTDPVRLNIRSELTKSEGEFSVELGMHMPMIQQMRDDLTRVGFQELRSAREVEEALNGAKGTSVIFVNSVCGCAGGIARPGMALALHNGVKPDHLFTVFAGQDKEATEMARSYFEGFLPSSPSVAVLRGGKIVTMVERRHIEGSSPEAVATRVAEAIRIAQG